LDRGKEQAKGEKKKKKGGKESRETNIEMNPFWEVRNRQT